MRRSFVLALLALVSPLAGVTACALVANLPDYDLLGEGDTGPVGRVDGDAVDGPIDPRTDSGGGTDAPIGVDAKPDVYLLGCGPPPATGLLAYYRLDEGSGTTASDCVSGGAGPFGGAGAAWVTGRIGPFALAFDGGGYVDIGGNAALAVSGAMSISAWVRIASFSTPGRVIAKGGGPNDRGWSLNVETDGKPAFQLAVDATTGFGADAKNPIPTGRWKHLAGTYEPGVAVRIYVDGVQDNVVTAAVPGAQRVSPSAANLGRRGGDGCCGMIGEIDDIRVFNRVLTPTEVSSLAAQ